MSRKYYYLVSSLMDLVLDTNKRNVFMDDFLNFCSEEMHPQEYLQLRKVFLFNDIKNAVNLKSGQEYAAPSYYTEEEFNENQKDTDSFLPFLAEFYFNKKNDRRLYPDLMEIDECVLMLYQHLDQFAQGFISDYLLFELDLQNITTALALKKNGLPLANKIIPYGDHFETILKSNSPDLGLGNKIDYIDKLVDAFKGDDLIHTEKIVEEIRWHWVDEAVGSDYFTAVFIYGYAIKLASIERWFNLSEEHGQEMLDKLINEIKNSVVLSDDI